MRNIIKSLFLLMFVVGVASYATWSYLSQTKKSGRTENPEVLGAKDDPLKIVLRGDGNDYNTPYFNVADMIPGETVTSCLQIINPDNSEDVFFRVYAEQTQNDYVDSDNRMADLLEVDFKEDDDGSLCNFPGGYQRYDTYTHPSFPSSVLLSNLTSPEQGVRGLNLYHDDTKVMKALKIGEAAVYQVSVTLDKTIGNDVMGKKWQGHLVVDAVQSLGQSTVPGDVEWQ